MSMQQAHRYCPVCQRRTLSTRPGTSHIFHLLMCVITVGFWLPIWILCVMLPAQWRCAQCGSRTRAVSFRLSG